MTALTDLSDIVHRVTGGSDGTPEHLFFWKDSRIAGVAAPSVVGGRMASLWRYNGQPAGGAIPGAVSVPTNTTDGSLRQTNPGGARAKWLLGMAGVTHTSGTLILYDRLLHIGGLSGTVITAQTVSGTLTRNTGGQGNQIWVEIYTAVGTTVTTITASYTNQAGTAGRTTPAADFGGTGFREETRLIPLPLAPGDTGVRAVASVTVLASTGTAGNFGVTIARPLLAVPMQFLGVGVVRDLIAGLPSVTRVDTDACLTLAWFSTFTAPPQLFGSFHFVEK